MITQLLIIAFLLLITGIKKNIVCIAWIIFFVPNGYAQALSGISTAPSQTKATQLMVEDSLPVITPKILFFAGGDIGWGYSSTQHGQARTFLGLHLSAIYKNFVYTLRYLDAKELQVSTRNNIVPQFNSFDLPIERTNETAFLVGYNYSNENYLFNASAGCSIQNNTFRGERIIGTTPESIQHEQLLAHNTFGFPVEAQILKHSTYFGWGLKLYYNVNQFLTTTGLLFTLQVGLFGV